MMTQAHERAQVDGLLRRLPSVALWTLAAACVLAWMFALNGSLLPAAGLVGAALVLVFVAKPELAAAGYLVATVTVIDPSKGAFPLGPFVFSPAELMLIAGLGAVVIRRLTRRDSPTHALFAGPVAVYLLASAVGVWTATQFGDAPREAIPAFRAMFLLSGYWILRDAFDGRPRALGRLLVLLGVVGSLAALIGTFLGLGVGAPQIDYVITAGQITETTRLASPLLRLLSLVIPMAFMGAVFARQPVKRWLLALAPMLMAEAVSLTRSTWVPLALVCLALPAATAAGNRGLLLIVRACVLGLAGFVIIGMAALGALGPAQVTYDRLASALDTRTVADDSLSDRTYELRKAIPTIAAHPATGVGLRQAYGAKNTWYDSESNSTLQESRRHIHNSLVGIWLWMGLLGVFATAWLAVGITRTSIAAFRGAISVTRGPPSDPTPQRVARAAEAKVALGAGGGLAVLLVQSTFQTNLNYVPALASLAAGLAMLDVWRSAHATPATQRDASGPTWDRFLSGHESPAEQSRQTREA